MAATFTLSTSGRKIGPYEIVSVLGEGGMAVVYLGEHLASRQRVALKTLRRADEGRLSRLRREIRALAHLDHPGIVRVLDQGVDDGIPWYAMELLTGRTLAELVATTWEPQRASADAYAETMPLRPGEALAGLDSVGLSVAPASARAVLPGERRPAAGGQLMPMLQIVRELCVALAFLHGEGIVHRDLKPDNVLLDQDGAPVLLDFGLAARSLGKVGREILDVAASEGTLAYVAPEQILGQIVDARADLYAVGCVLYEAVTGSPPFAAGSLHATLKQHLSEAPRPPSELVDGVPPALDELILRLLEKQPRRRLGHADDVALALATLGATPLRRGATSRPQDYVYRPELVGRNAALNELVTHLERAQRDQGGLVLVRGESGIGKTYLAMALARIAAERGLSVSAGSCVPIAVSGGDAAPVSSTTCVVQALRDERLHPFRPFLQTVVDRCFALGPAATAVLLGDRGPVLAACAPEVLELAEVAALPEPPELSPKAAHERLLRAMADTIFAASEQLPRLLVLDDLHWADELSLDLLALLAADPRLHASALLILGTYRVEETSSALTTLGAKPGVARLDLGRLDEASVGAMVGDMLALDDPPVDFVAFLTRQSGGNPFFVTEYLRTAVAEGLLRRSAGGRWEYAIALEGASAFERLPLPGSLRELIVHHLDLLSPGARELALCASVIGREVETALLPDVSGMNDAALLDGLLELFMRQLLDEPEPGRLRFLHDRLREVAYALIPDGTKRALHGRAARAIEARQAGSPELSRFYPQLAHHFTRAGATRKAIEYLEKAGVVALQRFENRKALAFFRDLVALTNEHLLGPGPHDAAAEPSDVARAEKLDAVDRIDLVRREAQLAQAYFGLGDLAATIRHASRALACGGCPQPKRTADYAALALREAATHAVHRLAPRALWMPREQHDRELCRNRALALYLLAQADYFADSAMAWVANGLFGLNQAVASGDTTTLAFHYASVGMLLSLNALHDAGQAYVTRGRAAAELTQDKSALAWVSFCEMVVLMVRGRWDEATARGAASIRLAEEIGDVHGVERVWLNAMLIAHWTDDNEGAVAYAERLARSAEARGDPGHVVMAVSAGACFLSVLGRHDDAAAWLATVERGCGPSSSGAVKLQYLAGQACCLLRRGELDAAVAAIESARLVARADMHGIFLYSFYYNFIDIHLALWDRALRSRPADVARARRGVRRGLTGFYRCAVQLDFYRPIADVFLGRALALAGAPRLARASFERSVAPARRYRKVYTEGNANLGLARIEPAGSPAQRAYLDRAEALFTALGTPREIAACRALRG